MPALAPQQRGLTSEEAARRLAADGRNEVLTRRASGWPILLARQVTDTIIIVLLVAALLTAVVGDLADMAVILAVVVINSVLGALQEVRSGQALAALAALTAPRATVVRDGVAVDIDAAEVVVGDLLRLAAGDVVPADAELGPAPDTLQVDESTLTGESVPVPKSSGDTVRAGTVVTRGHAEAVTTAVSDATAIGSIARSLDATEQVLTPVQRQLAVLGRRLAIVIMGAAAVVGAINFASGRSAEVSLVIAISLTVAAIPESLPAVVSLSLAMAARRMADRGVLARRLAAVEALGSITVLASDKTGTLTEGRMAVGKIWTPPGTDTDAGAVDELLRAAVLCSDACNNPSGRPGERDDPTELALIDAARDLGIDFVSLRAQFPRLAEQPFDALQACMSTEHEEPGGGRFTIRKGAPESVAPHSSAARLQAEEFALAGLRVLAVTREEGRQGEKGGESTLLGLVGLADPVRPEAAATIAAFRAAGVRPVMITGDHPATARAVGEALGLARPGEPVGSGEAADVDLDPDLSVFARVLPQQKTSIVRALQSSGEIVAMTGDGVNDAPALRAADIGVAMGKRGTEVAKGAADLILTGDDLSAMVPAIAEGRRAFDNLRRFLHYGLSGGLAEVLIMLFGPLFGFALPLQAGQILWVNLLTHGVPGVAMGSEPATPDVLTRAPRPPREALVNARTGRHVLVLGTVIALVSLGAGLYAKQADHSWQSTIFLSLGFAQLAVALALRPRRSRAASGHERNLFLPVSVVANAALAVLAVTWHPLRVLLRTDALTLHQMIPCGVAAMVAAVIARAQVIRPGGSARTVGPPR